MTKTTVILFFATAILTACADTSGENPKAVQEAASQISQTEQNSVIASGKEIAQNTFKTLSGNLKKAMATGGIENAINYCNANATNLMDSLGERYNAKNRRTSNKLRNLDNGPTESEKIILNNYLAGNKQGPIADLLPNGNKVFYAPIKIKPLCLSCHGTFGQAISSKDYATILKHYPNDKAIDYQEGDFRGIWSIELNK